MMGTLTKGSKPSRYELILLFYVLILMILPTKFGISDPQAHSEGGSTCMAVGGLFVVTSGRDQSLRLFNRTEEVINFLLN